MTTPVHCLTLDDFLTRFQLLCPPATPPARHLRQAAVLLPIVQRSQPGLLLTVRSPHLRLHKGQVAFPGGARDATDASLSVTAVRETSEETGIPAAAIRIIGSLPAIDSVSGFQVTPFAGLISAKTRWQASPAEVADIFEIPLAWALCLRHYHCLRLSPRRQVWLCRYQRYLIWGMTASILRRLALHIQPAASPALPCLLPAT